VAQTTPSVDQAAEARFKAGKQAFRLGDYNDAIKEWREAYRLKDNPAFLFNIAQAYREIGDLPKAVMFFENYLKESKNAPNRIDVEKRVAELKSLIAGQQASSRRPPTGPVDPGATPAPLPVEPTPRAATLVPKPAEAPPEPEPKAPPEPEPKDGPEEKPEAEPVAQTVAETTPSSASPGKTKRIAAYASGATGVVLLATGIVFGMKANSAQSEVETAVANGDTWTDDLDAKDASGRSAAMMSNVTLGLGAAAIVSGGVLFYLGRSAKAAERSTVGLVPRIGRDGLSVSLAGKF
jgi:tetratricopeptide (TPR) repeat protein